MIVKVQLPEIYFLNHSVDEVAHQIKLSIALRMYQRGEVSAGGACEITGLNRYDFLALCAEENIATIQYDVSDIEREIKNFKKC